MGHRVNQTRATQDLEAVPYSNPPQLEVISDGIHLGVPDGLALLIDPSTDIMGRLLVPMLPVAQTRILIQFYVLFPDLLFL
jgi:hypothetical protein